MIRRITGIANCSTRNSNSLDLVKKALYWQKMKGLETSTNFDKEEIAEKSSECLNQEGSGKNLTFFLKNLPKSVVENAENPIIKSPMPTK